MPVEDVSRTSQVIADRVDLMAKQLTVFAKDPATQTGIKDLILAHPLTNVKARSDGKVMILMDCNAFGEADSQPNLRVCPMDEAGTVPGGRGGGRGRGRGRGSTNAGAGDKKGDGAGDKGDGAGDKGDGAGPIDLAALLAEARKNSEEGGAS